MHSSRYREKQRKKTKYSSDSDSDREVSRKYREKSSSTKLKATKRRSKERSSRDDRSSRHKDRRKRYSSSSSSSSRSSSSSSRDSRSSSSSDEKSKSKTTSRSSSKKNFDHVTKFEINDLYKEEDKGKIIDQLESDTFAAASFQSKKKIVVDLQKNKIETPETLAAAGQEEESLIHPNFLGDEEAKVDKWIKKLHIYRSQP